MNLFRLNTSHFLRGVETSSLEIANLLDLAIQLKEDRKKGRLHPLLSGKTLAMLFDKPSLRTRFSFSVAMNELGGSSIESVTVSRKKEEPEDVARVLSGYCHGIMIRTSHDSVVERMAAASSIPVINGLSDLHHPCQILADLMTLKERFESLKGVTLAYLGDGNNILHSLLLMAPNLGVHLRYSCPSEYQPDPSVLKTAQAKASEGSGSIASFKEPGDAVQGVNAVYTDVWASMGFESEEATREKAFSKYQVNEELMKLAKPSAVVLHCLPMNRGKEITGTLADSGSSVIFQQSENRLHAQKALLVGLLESPFAGRKS